MLPLAPSIAITGRRGRVNYPLMMVLCYSKYCKTQQLSRFFCLVFLIHRLKKSVGVKINLPTSGLPLSPGGAGRPEPEIPSWAGFLCSGSASHGASTAACFSPGIWGMALLGQVGRCWDHSLGTKSTWDVTG